MSGLGFKKAISFILIGVCLGSCNFTAARQQTYRPLGNLTYSIVSYPEFTRGQELELSITIVNQSEQELRAQFGNCVFGTVEFRNEEGEVVLSTRKVSYGCTTDIVDPSILVPGGSRNFPDMPIDISSLSRGSYTVSLIYATRNPVHLFPAEDFVFERR